jgi:hypothetical protein
MSSKNNVALVANTNNNMYGAPPPTGKDDSNPSVIPFNTPDLSKNKSLV